MLGIEMFVAHDHGREDTIALRPEPGLRRLPASPRDLRAPESGRAVHCRERRKTSC